MANIQILKNWATDNLSQSNCTIKNLNWVDDYKLEFTDVHLEIVLEDRTYIGRGSDLIPDIAIYKALSESIERYALSKLNFKNSNGLACHYDLEKSKSNALNEKIERHLFLCHFHSSIPFKKITHHEFFQKHKNTIEIISQKKCELRFYHMLDSNKLHSVLCVTSGFFRNEPFGYVLGMGTEQNIFSAMEKSFLENLRKLSFFLNTDTKGLSYSEFINCEVYDFNFHGKLGLNIDYANSIKFLFEKDGYASQQIFYDVEYQVFDLSKIEILNKIPLFLAFADSKQLFDIYLGKPTSIRTDLLRAFCSNSKSLLNLNPLSHPIN